MVTGASAAIMSGFQEGKILQRYVLSARVLIGLSQEKRRWIKWNSKQMM